MTSVLLAIHHKGNQRLLKQWLSSQFSILEANSPEAFEQPFDLCIVDALALDQYEGLLRASKENQAPLFVPVLLIVQRQDVGLATRNLWQTVDELIISPIEKIELQARLHNLLLARQLSITLKRRDEELLRHSEERYRRLIENIPGVVYLADLGSNGETIFISPQVERLLGFPYEDWQADPQFWLKRIHPDDRERVLAANERCRVTGQPFHEEYRLVDCAGRIVWVEDSATVLPDEKGKNRWLQGTWLDITARKQTEESLRESEAKFKYVFEAANVGKSITLPTGKIFMNQAFADMLGYTREELSDKTWQELTPPEEVETIQSILNSLVRGEKNAVRFTKRYIHKNGSFIWADVSIALRRGADGQPLHFITTIVDITERKKAEDQLRASEELFAQTFHSSPAGMTITRVADGKFLDVNAAFCQMFELSREEVIGHTSTELNMWTLEERQKLIEQQIQSGGLQGFELKAKTKSGREITILFSSKIIEVGGAPHFLTTMIDITASKQAEEELHRSRDRLAELSRRLVKVHEKESRAIARELHDQIGQMLTAIKLNLEIASQLPQETAQKKYAQAAALVDELLQRVRNLSLELRPPMLDDLGLLPTLLWHTHHYQEQTGINVEFQHRNIEGRRFPSEIETTAYRIVQEALTNVARHAQARRARLEVRAEADVLEIRIEDNGIGFNLDNEYKYRSVGLSSMSERARLIGGMFQIQSEPGQGTTVFVRLPLKELQA